MYFKQKLAYMGLGRLFTIIGYMLASLGGDVDVQAQEDKSEPNVVDEIVCRTLRVVNADGKSTVWIGTDLGGGGYMHVFHPNGELATAISGGAMYVYHPNRTGVVSISTDSNGGYMDIRHASGERVIEMGINESSKEGLVQVWRKDQKGAIQLSADKYGGYMAIFNKGSQNVIQASVGDTGGGIVRTRDKHGYRTGHLP